MKSEYSNARAVSDLNPALPRLSGAINDIEIMANEIHKAAEDLCVVLGIAPSFADPDAPRDKVAPANVILGYAAALGDHHSRLARGAEILRDIKDALVGRELKAIGDPPTSYATPSQTGPSYLR